MTFKEFPTRIHPFDFHGLLEGWNVVDVFKTHTNKKLPICDSNGKIVYYDEQPIYIIEGKQFLQTSTVPVITEEGMKLR